MLAVKGLSKAFPMPRPSGLKGLFQRGSSARIYAVNEVSFDAHPGAILGLLGPNGAGKTTLLRMLSTAITPTAGTAVIDGADIVKDPRAVRKKIGFMSGTTGLYGRLSAREMVRYYGALHGMEQAGLERRMGQLFAQLEIESYADRRSDQLSVGMKQKVSIARTLIHDPEVVIFDEPTTGLDVLAAETVLDILRVCREQEKTVVFSTHHMHEVELLCDQVVIIREGRRCFTGTVSEMRKQTGVDKLDRAFLHLIGRAKEAA